MAPLAVSAPGLAAVTGRPSLVPSGSELTADLLKLTDHHTPAAITPWIRSTLASASGGKSSVGTLALVAPLSLIVTWVASWTLKSLPICPAAVCASPTMATNPPMPRIVPTTVSAARAGRWSRPASASLPRSRRRSRDGAETGRLRLPG